MYWSDDDVESGEFYPNHNLAITTTGTTGVIQDLGMPPPPPPLAPGDHGKMPTILEESLEGSVSLQDLRDQEEASPSSIAESGFEEGLTTPSFNGENLEHEFFQEYHGNHESQNSTNCDSNDNVFESDSNSGCHSDNIPDLEQGGDCCPGRSNRGEMSYPDMMITRGLVKNTNQGSEGRAGLCPYEGCDQAPAPMLIQNTPGMPTDPYPRNNRRTCSEVHAESDSQIDQPSGHTLTVAESCSCDYNLSEGVLDQNGTTQGSIAYIETDLDACQQQQKQEVRHHSVCSGCYMCNNQNTTTSSSRTANQLNQTPHKPKQGMSKFKVRKVSRSGSQNAEKACKGSNRSPAVNSLHKLGKSKATRIGLLPPAIDNTCKYQASGEASDPGQVDRSESLCCKGHQPPPKTGDKRALPPPKGKPSSMSSTDDGDMGCQETNDTSQDASTSFNTSQDRTFVTGCHDCPGQIRFIQSEGKWILWIYQSWILAQAVTMDATNILMIIM